MATDKSYDWLCQSVHQKKGASIRSHDHSNEALSLAEGITKKGASILFTKSPVIIRLAEGCPNSVTVQEVKHVTQYKGNEELKAKG